jgi:hypothetical protein
MGITVDQFPEQDRDPIDIMLPWPTNLEYVAQQTCILRGDNIRSYGEEERDNCDDLLRLVRASKAENDLNIGFRLHRFFDSGNRCNRSMTNVSTCSWGDGHS